MPLGFRFNPVPVSLAPISAPSVCLNREIKVWKNYEAKKVPKAGELKQKGR